MIGNELIQHILREAFSDEYAEKDLKSLFYNRLEELGISLNQAEELLGITKKSLSGIFDKTAKTVSVVNLLKIGSFIKVQTPEELLITYFAGISEEAIAELNKVRRANFIVENFNLDGLKDIGFITQTKDFEVIEERINKYFGLKSVFDYQKKIGVAFSSTRRSPNEKMLQFWVSSAYEYFHKIDNPNNFNRKDLIELIPKIRPYTQDEKDGLRIVAQALYRIGVTVVFQPYLPNTQIRGGTFIVNDKPCIVLTDLHKNYGTIWFALMHELHHVMYDFEEIQSENYHISEEGIDLLFVSEKEADEFAQEYLFSKERLEYIKPYIGNNVMVNQYARKIKIHPAIIYNLFAWEMSNYDKNYWPLVKKYSPKIQQTLEKLNKSLWDKETIEQSATELKNTLYSINH